MTIILHKGGPDPHWNDLDPVARIVRVRFRNGTVSKDALDSRKWRWRYGAPFPVDGEWDIVASEVVA